MSRTTRSFLRGRGRDGKHDWPTLIARDNRATGLRDHKRDRQQAKVSLRSGEDTAVAGKHRRYTTRYGTYLL